MLLSPYLDDSFLLHTTGTHQEKLLNRRSVIYPILTSSCPQRSSRHSYGSCFPTHDKLRCLAGMERAHEDISRAGRWPIRKIYSGDLNSINTCKFLPRTFAQCRFHGAYYLIKPQETFHRDGKEPPLIEKHFESLLQNRGKHGNKSIKKKRN